MSGSCPIPGYSSSMSPFVVKVDRYSHCANRVTPWFELRASWTGSGPRFETGGQIVSGQGCLAPNEPGYIILRPLNLQETEFIHGGHGMETKER